VRRVVAVVSVHWRPAAVAIVSVRRRVIGVHRRRAAVVRAVRVCGGRRTLLLRRRRHLIVGVHHNHVLLVGAHVRRHITRLSF